MRTIICSVKQPKFLFKGFLLLILISVVPIEGHSENRSKSSMNELRSNLNYMFAKINRDIVPTGLLRDYAIEYENLDKYDRDKGMTSNNVCDVPTYAKILNTLKSASLFDNPFKPFEKEINRSNSFSSDLPTARLSVALYEYAQIKANALTDNLISYEQGQVYCSSESAFQLRRVCAGCILDNKKMTNDVVFSLPQSFLLTNMGIVNVEIDCGRGFESILNRNVRANLNEGTHTIKIQVTDNNKDTYLAHTSITIYNQPSIQTRSFSSNITMYSWSGSYNGVTTSADVTIIKSSNNVGSKIRKPFLFVEGFDPRDFEPEGQGMMYCMSVYNRYWKDFIIRNGYDFIYVDWKSPGEYIQANAYTLIEVLKKIKEMSDENAEPTLLVGHSMGGLIARYALKTMENKKIPHGVGTYVSYDSPHLGANVPQGLLYGFYGIRKFLDDKDIISALAERFTNVKALMAVGERFAYSTAAQQMLVNYIDPTGHLNNSEHIHWQQELKQLGFPQGDAGKEFKMLGIANSDYRSIEIPEYYINCDFSAGTYAGTLIPPILSLAIGVGFQDVIAGLLCFLPGRDSVKGQFLCLPGSYTGQKVAHIEIGYKKDFLWIIPISKTVFSFDGYYGGSCLFDTYPSSIYDPGIQMGDIEPGGFPEKFPIIFDYGGDININSAIPFIPSSSALACGDGINNSPSIFTTRPTATSSYFGQNYYLEDAPKNQEHSYFSEKAQNWIEAHLKTSISGPSSGYTGAKYSLTSPTSSISWSCSNTSIAEIDQQGVLTVKGNGVTQIIALCNGISYSRTIIIGLPKYILSAKHEPDGFKIDATCIDAEFQPHLETVNRIIQYQWGVKFPNKPVNWQITNTPSIFVPLEDKDAVVFFKVHDANSNESISQSVKVNAYDVFWAENNHLKVDANSNIYKEDGSVYSYKNGKVYLTRDTSLPSDYQHDIWTSTKAVVFSPFANQYNVLVTRGEIPIKGILPQEELNYVISNSDIGQTNIYTIALLNPEDKIIQFLPFTITLK